MCLSRGRELNASDAMVCLAAVLLCVELETRKRTPLAPCHGRGAHILPHGLQQRKVYQGWWKDGKKHGFGVYTTSARVRYEGEWRFGKREGRGTQHYEDGATYIGEWRNDLRDGTGVWINTAGKRVYEGQYKKGLRHGEGSWSGMHGDSYAGSFGEGCMAGKGEFAWQSGERFCGCWEEPSTQATSEVSDAALMPRSMLRLWAVGVGPAEVPQQVVEGGDARRKK
eukprot:1709975-Pleurochrysis_carterae.AAC.1